jgi:hypothetical protein
MKIFISLAIVFSILSLSFISTDEGVFEKDANGGVCLKLEYVGHSNMMPPVDSTLMFPPSSACRGCHSEDPNGNAMVNFSGEDVSFISDWEATMMANSAKDPYWKAKVAHEVYVNPEHKNQIETTCTSCHAPMGHYTAILRGAPHYLMEDLYADTIGLDGVSCGSCHKIAQEGLGDLLGGALNIDTARVVYGPFSLPFAPPMQQFVGFEPLYSEHVSSSELCASCHTLVIESLDLEGQATGNVYIEQATYHEWVNSSYNSNNQSCQSCHLPVLEEPVIVSANYQFLEPRPHYSQHELVGGNATMLKMMKTYRDTLGITADTSNYDRTISKTLKLLQQQSLDASLTFKGNSTDTVLFEYTLDNKAGHKFPSGFPSRRAFVEFLLVDLESMDTIFHSGKYNEAYELANHNTDFEPHYDYISEESQVQIYELVPADINGDFTTILERGYQTIKDNRLVPLGFTKDHVVYDTVAIVGMAVDDPNYNSDDFGVDGTGSDKITFGIKLGTYSGSIKAYAKVHYQSLSPRWINPLFEDDQLPEVQHFKSMYELSDLEPILISSDSSEVLNLDLISGVHEKNLLHKLNAFPNPLLSNQSFTLDTDRKIKSIKCFNTAGEELNIIPESNYSYRLKNDSYTGLMIIRCTDENGQIYISKIIVQ